MKINTDLLLSMAIILLAIAIGLNIIYTEKSETSIEIDSTEIVDCYGLNLTPAAHCMKDYVKTFYNYTVRDERLYKGSDGTLEDVKLNGGDCTDYANIYKELAEDLGFFARTESMYNPDNQSQTGHRFTMIWGKEVNGYCIMDMLKITCTNLG